MRPHACSAARGRPLCSPKSDDGDDTDGNTEDDPTIVITDRVQVLEVTKNASITDNGDGVSGVEDIITYTIKVKNAGNVVYQV